MWYSKTTFYLKQWWVLGLNGHGLNFLLFQCFASSCNWHLQRPNELLCDVFLGRLQAAWVLVFELSKVISNQSMLWQSKEANFWLVPVGPFWRNSKSISSWLVFLWAKLLIGSLFLDGLLIGLFWRIPRQLVPDPLFWVKILLDHQFFLMRLLQIIQLAAGKMSAEKKIRPWPFSLKTHCCFIDVSHKSLHKYKF